MANITITDFTPFQYLIEGEVFEGDEFISLGAGTHAAGLVLGRVTASGKWTPYASGAVDGSQFPRAVLHEEIVTAGIETHATKVLTSGQTRDALTLVWTGGSPVVMSLVERDQLRDADIISIPAKQLASFDNS